MYSNLEMLQNYDVDHFDLQSSNNYPPLDDSYSLNNFKELFPDSQLLNNSSSKNLEGDIESAPAPLRAISNLNQNELANSSHNMECPPEVDNKTITNKDLDEQVIEMLKIFSDSNELIDKPLDNNLYFNNIENTNNNNNNDSSNNNNIELENNSAPMNVNLIPINENLNTQTYNLNNSNSNLQELSCPKNNFIITPFCSKNCRKKENILFYNTSERKRNKSKSTIIRKLKPDSLRKKIKARFHRKIGQIINNKLKEYGSKFQFGLFPQPFIKNINIEFNRPLLSLTMRELFQKTFGFKDKDREKANYNIKVIKYLEENSDICLDDEITNFLDSTYEEIIKKYMHGKYLLEDIERLKKEGENREYINRYIFIAMHWVEFYKNGGL
jgi:hypothetical protein